MVAMLLREIYLLSWSDASRTIPDKKKAVIIETLRTGLFLFLLGFLVWNLDNVFCGPWTQIKRTVGWPIAFFMEGEFIQERQYSVTNCLCPGHAWWHIFTVRAFGCFPN